MNDLKLAEPHCTRHPLDGSPSDCGFQVRICPAGDFPWEDATGYGGTSWTSAHICTVNKCFIAKLAVTMAEVSLFFECGLLCAGDTQLPRQEGLMGTQEAVKAPLSLRLWYFYVCSWGRRSTS